MITIMLVDDHPVVREGLRGMLEAEPDLTVIGPSGPVSVVVVGKAAPASIPRLTLPAALPIKDESS